MTAACVRKIRVVLADDYAITRTGIRTFLEEAPDIEVVGEAQNGWEIAPLVLQLRPNILLLDLQMPGPRPIEIERWLRANCPGTSTVVLTAHDRSAYLAEMQESGAVGFLHKGNTTASRLIGAIRRVADGATLFDVEQVNRIRHWHETVGAKWQSLTSREREVLTLIVQGKTDREIALHLHLKLKTVGNHVSKILDKLELASRTEAAMWAVKEYLINPLGA